MALFSPGHPRWLLHERAHARFGPFADLLLPMDYGSSMAEYTAVRQRVGIFDVSHMGRLKIEGPDATWFLNGLLTGDVSTTLVDQTKYSLICDAQGGIIDDVVVARTGPSTWLCCANATRLSVVLEHFHSHRLLGGGQVHLQDQTDDTAQFAVQGPLAWQVAMGCFPALLQPLQPWTCWSHRQEPFGEIVLSATGYTGELGFEITCAASVACSVWQSLMAHGQEVNLVPCGLVARDMLRLEMYFPLYGTDMNQSHTPWQADLARFVRRHKIQPFVGQQALMAGYQGHTKQRVALKLLEKGIPRSGCQVMLDGQQVGLITSGGYSPALQTGIGMAMVDRTCAQVGQQLIVRLREKNLAAQVIQPPFYTRKPTA